MEDAVWVEMARNKPEASVRLVAEYTLAADDARGTARVGRWGGWQRIAHHKIDLPAGGGDLLVGLPLEDDAGLTAEPQGGAAAPARVLRTIDEKEVPMCLRGQGRKIGE